MFDSLKNIAGLPGMMAKAKEMQDRMKALQEELATRQFSAESPGGEVTAIVDGKMTLLRVRIDPAKFGEASDMSSLEQSIVLAVSAAQQAAASAIQSEMSRLTSELGLPPGLLPS